MKRTVCLVLSLLCACGAAHSSAAAAGEADAAGGNEVTAQCALTVPDGSAYENLLDENVMTRVYLSANESVAAALPEGGAKFLAVQWFAKPASFTVSQLDANGDLLSKKICTGTDLYTLHALDERCRQVRVTSREKGAAVSRVRVFSGDAPAEVLRRTEHAEKADLLLVLPDPESLFEDFSALAPYALGRGASVSVAFMTYGKRYCAEELYEALSRLGLPEAEYVGMADRDVDAERALNTEWDDREAINNLVELIGRLKPSVVVTTGQFDASARARRTGTLVQKAVKAAASDDYRVKKLYALAGEGTADTTKTVLTAPSERLSGLTPLAAATDAYGAFSSRRLYHKKLYDSVSLTLLATEAGPDEKKDDPFEHIAYTVTENAYPPAAPADAAAESPFAERFTDRGESEVVYADEENGVWSYKSDILAVDILRTETVYRRHGVDEPAVYYTAHIYEREADSFLPAFGAEEKTGMVAALPADIAARYQAVLFLSGDFIIRDEKEKKGILIRDGILFSDNRAETFAALDRDNLSMRVYGKKEVLAEALLESGVENTFSFGPILIEDGAVNPGLNGGLKGGKNPRCAIGLVEDGHFVAIVVDGRQEGYSEGVNLLEMAELMKAAGCQTAYNLDGGVSACMLFLGKQVNHHGQKLRQDDNGPGSFQRRIPDGLIFGSSTLYGSVE